jgi:hypothetical protein
MSDNAQVRHAPGATISFHCRSDKSASDVYQSNIEEEITTLSGYTHKDNSESVLPSNHTWGNLNFAASDRPNY